MADVQPEVPRKGGQATSPEPTLPEGVTEALVATGPEGLSATEAATRLARFGPNEVPEEHQSTLRKLLGFLWGPIPWMIEAAAVLALLGGHLEDFAVIATLLVVNVVVGFTEERQAGNAIAALRSRLALQARVRRDGAWTTLPARELVPGDRVRVRLGDVVPADLRLEGGPLEVDQSALTGESLPVDRDAGDGLFSGSIVRRGEADAVVTATGASTSFGRITTLVSSTKGTSHFQQAVLRIGNYLIALAVGLVLVILLASFLRGETLLETLRFALVLLVAAIPAAMPTVLSVTLALGARALAKREAIVSRLTAVEELAGMSVLCSDKTGTLTQNHLTVGDVVAVGEASVADVLQAAALASRAEDQDAIDLAVLAATPAGAGANLEVVAFQPFDPDTKRSEATVRGAGGGTFRVTKGALQVVEALVGATDATVEARVRELAARGYRALGVARAEGDGPWRLLGVVPLFDPPREDSRATIADTRAMGIGVKMLTGDQLPIAREIARQLDLGERILDAGQVDWEAGDVAAAVETADGFAQVLPEHKFRIVEALQGEGVIVGMTGDGVNDAPALKRADAGIAVSGATDAARAAADIVLVAPGLSVITEAVREARRVFERMTSYATYRIAETVRVLLFLTAAILVLGLYPISPIMLVLLAILNDGAILSIAYDRAREAQGPVRWDMTRVLGLATVLGLAGVVASFGILLLGSRVLHLGPGPLQTLVYLKLSVAGHLTIFITRTRGPFWSHRPAGVLVGAVVGTQTLATLLAVTGTFMAPIPLSLAALVWIYALAWFVVNDRVKILALRFLDRRRAAEPPARPQRQSGYQTVRRAS